MDFSEVVTQRRSVRNYDASKEITDDQLKELFEMAKHSPSSYNLQPWEFVIVRNKKNKERIKNCAYGQQHVAEASAVIIVLGTTNPLKKSKLIIEDRIKKGLMDEEKQKHFEQSVKKISENKNSGKIWTIKSTTLCAMTIMLAAQNMGLSTCPMEGFNANSVKKEFQIPEEYEVVMLITLGYGNEKNERPFRLPYEDIVHLENYGQK